MKHKVLKAGNSLVVVIPSLFIKSVGVKKGDEVGVYTNISKGKIVYTFKGTQQLSLTENLYKNPSN